MGIVVALGTALKIITRRSRILLFAVVIATVGFIAPASDANTLFASQIGTLDVSPSHAGLTSTVSATVFDPDLNVTVLREFETTDSTGNLYELPVGAHADTTVFKLQNASVGDFNGDGSITAEDVQISTTKASVQWVNKDSGTFQIIHGLAVSTPENFTVTYRSEHKDTTSVTLRTAADPVGFTMSLLETTPTSHTFTATFKTGAATATTGASSAASSTRPVVKVTDGDTVTLEYADVSPAKLISEAVVVDGTKPSVSITSPKHLSSNSNITAWGRVIVTDAASGVELSQIKYHVDLDRDDIFDEPGEIVDASIIDSVAVNQGWSAIALLPGVGSDGPVNWYVTATDRSGNTGVSDSTAVNGDQAHTYTVDTSPPALLEVVLGETWDLTASNSDASIVGDLVSDRLNTVKVKWSEPIKESRIDASRFFINGESAKTATMVAAANDTVWLTYEDIPTSSQLLTIMPGAVTDITEFPSALKEVNPIDRLGPRLTVSTDTTVTNKLLTIKVTTVETLTEAPTVTINGVTFGSAQPLDTNEWEIIVDGTTFTGSAAGDGVKNVEAAGFDAAVNIARGGVAIGSAGYPTGAVQFHLDTVMKEPLVVPGDREVSLVSNPLITVSFADEIGEYLGDTHSGVTIINAKLDGADITSGFTSESATTWSYRPSELTNASHTLEVVGRDDAGNTHSPIVRVFNVDAPPPTATPVPTETPTPTPTVEIPPTVEGAPTEIPTDPESTDTPADIETPADSTPEVPEEEAVATPETVPPPEETAAPETAEPNAAPEDAPTVPDPVEVPTPVPGEDPPAEGEEPPADGEDATADDDAGDALAKEGDDIAATVAAMRAADEDLADNVEEGEEDPSIAPGTALTVFGCNLPTGKEAVGGVIAGGDYLLAVAGLFGLIVARVRPKLRKRPNSRNSDE
jgi:hypothetical protein